MKKWLFFLIMSCQASVFAVLPPLYTTLDEFKALIESKELTEKLESGESIMAIRRNRKDGFSVITNKHVLFVDVETIPDRSGKVGPKKFVLKFHEPIERTALPSKRP